MEKVLATRFEFGKELIRIAEDRKDFVVFNSDTKAAGLELFGDFFPEREFSFGIAEQNLVSAAAGMAACGNKVFFQHFQYLHRCAHVSRSGHSYAIQILMLQL